MTSNKPNKFETELANRKASVDRLIDHYEKYGPADAGRVIRVDCFPEDLPFAVADEAGKLYYRGRVLLPVAKKKMTKREFNSRHNPWSVQ